MFNEPSAHILTRFNKTGAETKYRASKSQISYNSDGHIVIRLIIGNMNNEAKEDEALIVLDERVSKDLIRFVKHSIKYPVGVHPLENENELPF